MRPRVAAATRCVSRTAGEAIRFPPTILLKTILFSCQSLPVPALLKLCSKDIIWMLTGTAADIDLVHSVSILSKAS